MTGPPFESTIKDGLGNTKLLKTFEVETLTVDSTAGGTPFTEAKWKNASGDAVQAIWIVETAAIRYVTNPGGSGVVPTASVGTPVEAGSPPTITTPTDDIASIRFFPRDGANATIHVEYQR